MAQTIRSASGDAAPGRQRSHYQDTLYYQDGFWLTAVLVAALYFILAAALDAAGHTKNLSIVTPVTAGAFALGLLMSLSRFDGFFALSHSMFVGLAWILFSMAQIVPMDEVSSFLNSSNISELQARVYFVLLRLLDWIDAAISRTASADNYVFIFEICFLLWWLTYLGVWSIFRYGYTWRAVIPAGIVLLINTYYAPQSTVGFLLAFVLVALVLLVRTNLSEQQLRWRADHIYFQPDIVWDFLRNGILFSALLVLLAWVMPGLGRNSQLRALLTPVNTTWESTAENVQRLYQGLNRQPSEIVASFDNTLTLGGERNVSDSPVFQAQTAQARYWRAVVFDTYDGRRWLDTADGTAQYDAGEIVPVPSWRARTAISQTITLLAPVGTILFGMPDVAQSDVRVNARVRSQAGAVPIPAATPPEEGLPVEFTMMHTDRDLFNGDRYVIVSAATEATVRDLEGATTDYPPEILERYLQIPTDFSPRVIAEAQRLVAGLPTPYNKTKAIEGYLRTIPYNDAIAPPPPDTDPIEYFLYEIQQGYCDYYATAMAMMLRAVGVPARTASGYAEGIFDEESGYYFVTERDAHTWVEVFFPEYGWIEFEPTAGESPLERLPGEDRTNVDAAAGEAEPTPQPDNPAADATPPPAGREDLPPPFTGEELIDISDTEGGSVTPWWLLMLALLLVIPLGALLVWRVRSNGPTRFTADLPVLLYERMEGWSQRLGLPLRVDHTPYEHAERLSAALPDTAPLVHDVTDSYVRYRFGGPAQSVDLELAAEGEPPLWQTWRKLEGLFWKRWRTLWGRRVLRRSEPPEFWEKHSSRDKKEISEPEDKR